MLRYIALCCAVLLIAEWAPAAEDLTSTHGQAKFYGSLPPVEIRIDLPRRYGAIEQAELEPGSQALISGANPWLSPAAAYEPSPYGGGGWALYGYGPGFGYWPGYRWPIRYGYFPDYWRYGPYPRFRPFPYGQSYWPYYSFNRERIRPGIAGLQIVPANPTEPLQGDIYYW